MSEPGSGLIAHFYGGKHTLAIGDVPCPAELAKLCLSIMSSMAYVEASILDVAVESVGGPDSSGALLLLEVKGAKKRTEAAQRSLLKSSTGSEYEIIKALLDRTKAARNMRNMIAHGIIAGPPAPDPNSLIVFNSTPEKGDEALSGLNMPIPLSFNGEFHKLTSGQMVAVLGDMVELHNGFSLLRARLAFPEGPERKQFDDPLRLVFSHLRIQQF